MRGRLRRRRDRLAVFVAIGLIAAAGLTSVVMMISRHSVVAFASRAPAARPAAPAQFDHFGFSALWLVANPPPNLPIRAQAAYLVDLDTRQVLWERDPDTTRAPASLTKLITAMVAVDDAGSLDRSVEVAREATQITPSVMGLSPGEHLTVRELLAGLLLDSGNDAAEALARGIVPRDRFIRQMNQKAKAIGLTDSHFVNPSGLDAPGHGMSAHDLAHVAAYLGKYYPDVAAIAGTKDIVIPATSDHKAFYPHNLNRLLWSYPGDTGLKTGLTDNAGGCMLATATRDGRHLVAVVLNDTGRSTEDAAVLLNYGFSVHPQVSFFPWSSASTS
jgi:D-alanyl-D-alanine carboxypeptidase (penicillin-binding protein 5/6)